MATGRKSRVLRTILLLMVVFFASFPAQAQYGGGSGTAEDPYRIWTAEQMNTIGTEPNDWDKHFKLMADIDLAAYTGAAFNIIGRAYYDAGWIENPFSGVFDGNGHTISNFTYDSNGVDYIGLFGYVRGENAQIKDLGLINPNIDAGTGDAVGPLVGGLASGTIFSCYAQGADVSGNYSVGGLVGTNDGAIINCYSRGRVSGDRIVAGLTGHNADGTIANCYSAASVSGELSVGGLVGRNDSVISNSYARGSIVGSAEVGGLVGLDRSFAITNCYSSGSVSGDQRVGALVGMGHCWPVRDSFWDIETSGQSSSCGGTGKTTTEMQDINTFLAAGWDFVGEFENGPSDHWAMPAGGGYPILWWQLSPLPALPTFTGGAGTADDPYLISTAQDLNRIGHNPRLMAVHFKLMNDIDMSGIDSFVIGSELFPFTGALDGNSKEISNFSYASTDTEYIGLFGDVNGENAQVKDLGMINPNVDGGRGSYVGSLIGRIGQGTVTNCYAEGGSVSGSGYVGGLVGSGGAITNCYCSTSVSGNARVGGLVGDNYKGSITTSYSTGAVSGSGAVGGLVGGNGGTVAHCYSTGAVSGTGQCVGGLVGLNRGMVTGSYSVGGVTGNERIGGLVGDNTLGTILASYSLGKVSGTANVGGLIGIGGGAYVSYWDTQTSGLSTSSGGAGRTTAEMQMASTFVGWSHDPVWTIDEGKDYPRLWWENMPGEFVTTPSPFGAVAGTGTEMDPYLIYTAQELNMIGQYPYAWDKHFKLMADIDLSAYTGTAFNIIGRYGWPFSGVFDGNGKRIADFCFTSPLRNDVGLFSRVKGESAQIKNLGLLDPNIDAGTAQTVGSLVGLLTTGGTVANCYAEGGSVTGGYSVGGLVGYNGSTITDCTSSGSVSGSGSGYGGVGGLVGTNSWAITNCYSSATASGDNYVVGGLVGINTRTVSDCYSTGSVTGTTYVGGLIGLGYGEVSNSFWDIETSGQSSSAGGVGLTTAGMQMESTFAGAGWDFVAETENGTEDIWSICEGVDYPHLAWEFVIGDFDADADTDLADFRILAERWLAGDGSFWCGQGCDLTNDGSVNWQDLMVFAQNWLR